jgi:kynurenine formamidase
MKYIDLTHTFGEKMPVYPGDPEPSLTQIAEIAKEGFTDHEVKTCMHVGTHIDAPLHMIENGKLISDFPLEHFFGKGHLVDARKKESVDVDLLDGISLGKGDIVLVMTGLSAKYHDDAYLQYPELTVAFAQRLVDAKVSIVGMDIISPDREPYATHKVLLGNDVLIIENLTNLKELIDVPAFEVIALPWKLQANGAPVRVVARVEE